MTTLKDKILIRQIEAQSQPQVGSSRMVRTAWEIYKNAKRQADAHRYELEAVEKLKAKAYRDLTIILDHHLKSSPNEK